MDATGVEPLINLSDITEIELLILKRMREFTIGEHASRFHGSGFDFVGLRDWQAGDRFETIDWPQSSLTNFSPLIIREFEQPSTSSVVMVADRSLSTRCGIDGVPIAATIARAIATDRHVGGVLPGSIGLITFDTSSRTSRAVRPRIGKGQVIHCLDAYQYRPRLAGAAAHRRLAPSLAGFMRKTSMVPVISDFLFDDVEGWSASSRSSTRARRLPRAWSTRRSRSSCRRCRPAGSRRSTSRPGASRVMSRRELRDGGSRRVAG